MLHGHVAFGIALSAFGMTYLLPICFCAPTFLPVRCNHTMDNELNEWPSNAKQIMLHILARIMIIAIKCRKSRAILVRFVILFSFFNKFMFPPKHYMLKDSIERN